MQNLEEMIRQLPPELQQEVTDFVQFLLEKRSRRTGKPLRQDWAGDLREYRHEYTSMELQKKALEWRDDGTLWWVDEGSHRGATNSGQFACVGTNKHRGRRR